MAWPCLTLLQLLACGVWGAEVLVRPRCSARGPTPSGTPAHAEWAVSSLSEGTTAGPPAPTGQFLFLFSCALSLCTLSWSPSTTPHALTLFIEVFSSVAQSCPTLCNPMDCSTPGFPVHHQLLELTQTHVHRVGDAIQPSHPLSSPSPPAFSLSQHQGLFK